MLMYLPLKLTDVTVKMTVTILLTKMHVLLKDYIDYIIF